MTDTKAFMTIEQAREIERRKVIVGATYTFYSDCVHCESDDGELIRNYSGQPVTVIGRVQEKNEAMGEIGMVRVRAANGTIFTANDGELNGWIFDTGQWVGPRVN